jgi:F420-dependent oxidoreductase-like protein
MRMGVMLSPAQGDNAVETCISEVRRAADEGFHSAWMAQLFDLDAVTALALAGHQVGGIEVGTAVVPTFPRHPLALAFQALTAAAATANRFVLGIGLSHQLVIENAFGIPFARPARHMSEYLAVLKPALAGEMVSVQGETLKAQTFAPIRVAGAAAPPILVAALGSRMLKVAGEQAEGTITWMTGPATLADHTVPTIAAAAEAAGWPRPRVVAGLPVCVTSDADAARDLAAKAFAIYNNLPSYRAMLDREGAAGPADVAVVGSEDEVAKSLRRLADAGVTDFCGALFGSPEDQARTRRLLLDLAE